MRGGAQTRRGFTLVEILVALVIMAVIVGTAVASVAAGMKSARLGEAARAVQQYARHAKAVALLKQRPVVLTIEEIAENGEFVKSRLSISYSADDSAGSAAMASGGAGFGVAGGVGTVQTLSGEDVVDSSGDAAAVQSAGDAPDPLAAEPREFEGIRIHAEAKENLEANRPRISVFSNVDFLLRKSAEKKAEEERKAAERQGVAASGASGGEEDDDAFGADSEHSFSAVYEANGRCEPYVVRVWKEGADERDALEINVGRFGRPVTSD